MPVTKKIVADPTAIEDFIIEQGVKAIPKKSKEIIIDFDATDDPLHGHQEGGYFHGYYRHYCYLPLYAFCGNIPLWAELRECKIDGCKGTVEALKKIVPAIRKRFGKKVRIILRGDGGFAREDIMAWCESQPQLYYCLGYSVNARLKKAVAKPLWKLRQEFVDEQVEVATSVRRFTELRYRTSTHWMASNQLRLWFSVIAHIIMNRLKACVLKGTELEKATIGQVRLKLFKIAVRIKVSVRRVLLEFASSFPRKKLFEQCIGNLERLDEMAA